VDDWVESNLRVLCLMLNRQNQLMHVISQMPGLLTISAETLIFSKKMKKLLKSTANKYRPILWPYKKTVRSANLGTAVHQIKCDNSKERLRIPTFAVFLIKFVLFSEHVD